MGINAVKMEFHILSADGGGAAGLLTTHLPVSPFKLLSQCFQRRRQKSESSRLAVAAAHRSRLLTPLLLPVCRCWCRSLGSLISFFLLLIDSTPRAQRLSPGPLLSVGVSRCRR